MSNQSNQSTIYRQAASLTDAEEALLLLVLASLTKLSTEPTMLSYSEIAEHYGGRNRAGIRKGANCHRSIAAVAARLVTAGWVERTKREHPRTGACDGREAKHAWRVTPEGHEDAAPFAWCHAEALIAWAVERRLGSRAIKALLCLCKAAGAGGAAVGSYKELQTTLSLSRCGIVGVIEQRLQDAGALRVSDEPEAGTGKVLRIQLLTPFAADEPTAPSTVEAEPEAATAPAGTATSPKAAPARTTEVAIARLTPQEREREQARTTQQFEAELGAMREQSQTIIRALIKHLELSLKAGGKLTPSQRLTILHDFVEIRDERGSSQAAEEGVKAVLGRAPGDVGNWKSYALVSSAKHAAPSLQAPQAKTNADVQREREAAEAQARADARRQEDDARWQAAQQHAARANARKVTKAIDISLAKLASMTAERELTEQQREQTDAWVERMATKMVVADLADNEFDAMGVLWGAINERKLTLALAS